MSFSCNPNNPSCSLRELPRSKVSCLATSCLAAVLLWLVTPAQAHEEPAGIFLTWQQDATSTMTIDWQTSPDHPDNPILHFRPADSLAWETVEAESLPFPHSDRTIHRVELTGLQPDSRYEFRPDGYERIYHFHTLPQRVDRPLTFAIGGDVRHQQEWMERTNRVAMEYEPEFIVWGGDLAYADGVPARVVRWYEWFEAIQNTLITSEGRVIPIIVGIGNHEMMDVPDATGRETRRRRYAYYRHYDNYEDTDEWRAEHAPFFFGLFAFPGQPGYGVLDLNEDLTFLILDSKHANPVQGTQEEWLKEQLHERPDRPYIFPVYHIPAYPSASRFDQRGAAGPRIRRHWIPHFEEAGIRVAFENHDHTYKRTPPIRADEVVDAESGIVYMGDGAWGVNTKSVHDAEETWYLDKAIETRHAILVTLDEGRIDLKAVSETGEVIDQHRIEPLSPGP